MSSWPSFSVITPLQFLPSINLAQMANRRPLTHRKTPPQEVDVLVRNDEPIERWRQHARFDDQKITDYQHEPIPCSLRAAFAVDRAFLQATPSDQTIMKMIQQT